MRCPLTADLWRDEFNEANPRVHAHLASCAVCRAEAGRFAQLQAGLSHLPQLDVPTQTGARTQALLDMIADQHLTCEQALTLLEPWRDGALDRVQAFLLEDHLLWCQPCTRALERAEQIAALLHTLPALEAPAAIAERIAVARLPWWQQLLPKTTLSWAFSSLAGATAAAMLVLALLTPPATTPIAKGPSQPIHPVAAPVTPAPKFRFTLPQFPAPLSPHRALGSVVKTPLDITPRVPATIEMPRITSVKDPAPVVGPTLVARAPEFHSLNLPSTDTPSIALINGNVRKALTPAGDTPDAAHIAPGYAPPAGDDEDVSRDLTPATLVNEAHAAVDSAKLAPRQSARGIGPIFVASANNISDLVYEEAVQAEIASNEEWSSSPPDVIKIAMVEPQSLPGTMRVHETGNTDGTATNAALTPARRPLSGDNRGGKARMWSDDGIDAP